MADPVIELVAAISVDNKQIVAATKQLEKLLTDAAELSNKLDKQVATSRAASNESRSRSNEQEALRSEKAAQNLADFLYKTEKLTTDQYKLFLAERVKAGLEADNEYQANWKSAADNFVRLQSVAQKKVTADLKAEQQIRDNILRSSIINTGPNWAQSLKNFDKQALQKTIQDINNVSVTERAAASAKLLALDKEDATAYNAMLANTEAGIANFTKFQYEQGLISSEQYKAFLVKRMEQYDEYTAQWKSAASALTSFDKAQLAERLTAEKAFNAEAEAITKERFAAAKANAAEYYAWFNTAEAKAATSGILDQTFASKANATNTKNSMVSGSLNGLGALAAGITAVDLASTLMSTSFNHNLYTIANNTLMTTDQIKSMREETLKLGTETGQSFNDIMQGYMHISNFGFSGEDTSKIINLANMEAVGTNSQTSDVSNSLAAALHIFHATADEAPAYIDILHHASAAGNMFVQDFVTSAGPALAIAAEMKDSFSDAAISISLLTRGGFTPSEAATQIKSVVSHIAKPSSQAEKYIKLLQETYDEKNPQNIVDGKRLIDLVADYSQPGIQEKGIRGIMLDSSAVTGGNAEEMMNILPALRGGIGGTYISQMLLDGPHGEAAQLYGEAANLQTSNSASETKGIYDRAMQNDPSIRWKALVNTIQSDFLPVGEKATKIFLSWEPALLKLTDGLLDVMTAFQKLPQPVQNFISVVGGLFILNKVTGLLTALRIPVAFSTSLKGLGIIVESLAKGFTSAETVALVFGTGAGEVLTGLASVALPVVIGIAAIGAALWAGKKAWDYFTEGAGAGIDTSINYTRTSREQAAAQVDSTQKNYDNVASIKELVDHYESLGDKSKYTNKEAADAQATLNKISLMAPELISGYTDIGNAIGLIGDKSFVTASLAQSLTDKLTALNYAKRDSINADMLTDKNSLTDQQSAIQNKISVLKASLSMKQVDSFGNVAGPVYDANTDSFIAPSTDPAKDNAELRSLIAQSAELTKRYKADMDLATNVGQPDRLPIHNGSRLPIPLHDPNGGLITPLPGIGRIVSPSDLSAEKTKLAQEAADRKKQAEQLTSLNKLYLDQLDILNKIALANDKAKEDLTSHTNWENADYLLSQGKLKALGLSETSGKGLNFMNAATAADNKEHANYIADIEDNLHKKMKEDSLPVEIRKVISDFGIEAGKWFDISEKDRQSMILFSREFTRLTNTSEAKHRATENQEKDRLSLPENAGLARAVEDAGGQDKWNLLGAGGVSPTFMGPIGKNQEYTDSQGHTKAQRDAISVANGELDTTWLKYIKEQQSKLDSDMEKFQNSNNEKLGILPTDAGIGKAATDEVISNMPDYDKIMAAKGSASDSLQKYLNSVSSSAVDKYHTSQHTGIINSLTSDSLSMSNEQNSLSNSNLSTYQRGVQDWISSHQEIIKQINQEVGGLKLLDLAYLNYNENQAGTLEQTKELSTAMRESNKLLEDANKAALVASASSPWQKYLDVHKDYYSNGNGTKSFRLAGPSDATSQSLLQNQLHSDFQMQEKVDEVKQAGEEISGVLTNAFNEAYDKGFSKFFQNVTQGMKKLVYDDLTKKLTSSLTGNLEKLFLPKGKTTLPDINTNMMNVSANTVNIGDSGTGQNSIIPSQGASATGQNSIIPWANNPLFSEASATGSLLAKLTNNPMFNFAQQTQGASAMPQSGGGGGFLGILSSLFSLMPGNGAAGLANSTFNAMASGNVVLPGMAGGGRYDGPFIAGEFGVPELVVPDTHGSVFSNSDLKNALSTSNNSGSGPQSNHYHVHISTPDVQGMVRSKNLIAREMHNMVAKSARRDY